VDAHGAGPRGDGPGPLILDATDSRQWVPTPAGLATIIARGARARAPAS
jgi:hypothetical protein